MIVSTTLETGIVDARVRYPQESVLYQWGAPLQLVLDGVRHKSLRPDASVLHGGLLRRIAIAVPAAFSQTGPAPSSVGLQSPQREHLLRHTRLRLLHLLRLRRRLSARGCHRCVRACATRLRPPVGRGGPQDGGQYVRGWSE